MIVRACAHPRALAQPVVRPGNRELVLGVLDALLELPPVTGGRACVQLLELGLRGFELSRRACVVDLLHVDGIVDEGERRVGLDLEEPGSRGELQHLAPAEVHARRTGLQRGDERCMAREHADLSRLAGHDQHLGFALVHRAVGRHDGDVELGVRVGHR